MSLISAKYRVMRGDNGYSLQQRWYYFGIPVTSWILLFENYIQKDGEIDKLIRLCGHKGSKEVRIIV